MKNPLALLTFALLIFHLPSILGEDTRGEEEDTMLDRIEVLRITSPHPTEDPKPEAFPDEASYRAALEKIWAPFWAKEFPRMWKLSQVELEFLTKFPDHSAADFLKRDAVNMILECTRSQDEIGAKARDWLEKTLAKQDLPASEALPIYSYQANMIGLSANQPYKILVKVASDPAGASAATAELLDLFSKRYPNSRELGELYLFSSQFAEERSKPEALLLLSNAALLLKDTASRELIATRQFRLTSEGKKLPRLQFKSLAGADVDTEALKGKVIVLHFWATWSWPCIEKLPEIKELYQDYAEKGLEVISISLDLDKRILEEFIATEKLNWHHKFEGEDWDNSLSKQFGVGEIPSLWVINKEGIITSVEPPELKIVVKELFEKK